MQRFGHIVSFNVSIYVFFKQEFICGISCLRNVFETISCVARFYPVKTPIGRSQHGLSEFSAPLGLLGNHSRRLEDGHDFVDNLFFFSPHNSIGVLL